MEQETNKEDLKFYSLKSVSIATFIGGPMAAAILIRRNFLNQNEDGKALNTLFIGIITTILLFVFIFSIPETFWDKFPNSIFPAIYTGIVYLIAERTQGRILKEHKENNGGFFSAWKAAGIGLIFTVITVAVVFGYFFLYDTEHDFDATLYDEKIEQFIQNEAASLAVFDKFDYLDENELIIELKSGILLWGENYEITREIQDIDNLPPILLGTIEKLQEYSSLRIEFYNLFIKALSEESDHYTHEIERVANEINRILAELN